MFLKGKFGSDIGRSVAYPPEKGSSRSEAEVKSELLDFAITIKTSN